MNDELKNNQSGPTEPVNKVQVNCTKCQKNPCICPNKKTLGEKATSKNNRPRTKPPKISWI